MIMYAYQLCKHAGITNRQRKYWTDKGILVHPVINGQEIRNGYHAREAFKAALANHLIKTTRISVQRLYDFFNRLHNLIPEERVLADCILILTWISAKNHYDYEILICKGPLIKEFKLGAVETTIVDMYPFWPEEFR